MKDIQKEFDKMNDRNDRVFSEYCDRVAEIIEELKWDNMTTMAHVNCFVDAKISLALNRLHTGNINHRLVNATNKLTSLLEEKFK